VISWQLKVSKVDGSVEMLAVGPRQIVAFERHWKIGLAKAFTVEQRMEHLFWLAWEAERSAGRIVPLFGDDYFETLANVEVVGATVPFVETA